MTPSQASRPEGHRAFYWIAIAATVGVLIGLALIPRAGARAGTGEAAQVRLYGRLLPAELDASETTLAWVRERLGGWFTLELPDGQTRRISYGALGVELDRNRLRHLARDARDENSALYQRHRSPSAPIDLIVPVRLNPARALPILLALKDELDQSARPARLDLDRDAVLPERAGRLLDVDASVRAIEAALEAGAESAALAFVMRQPGRLASELTNIRHAALLGFFETPYDPAARARDRTFNLQLAASRLDGYVLMPGDEFDFNAVVGPRDEANGYRVAKVIAQGELVDGIGGGTCQISGTLHAAALFAGLDIVERHPHTRPSSYIKLGFDAAVAYPTINFRVKNPYDFPVVLRETLVDGRLRAEVRGERRPHTISVVRKIDAATPFEELSRPDDTLPHGVRVLAQRGVPGIDLHRYRIRRDGAHAVRETVIDRYPPTTQLIRVGRGRASNTTGRPPHAVPPEYLADELLVLSQSAELEAPLVEQRTPGRFGAPGWTKEIGAPAWDPDP